MNHDLEKDCASNEVTWIRGVLLCAYATIALLILNILAVSLSEGLSSKYLSREGAYSSKVIFTGRNTTVRRLNLGLGLAVNIISTAILGASNYCMQTLMAPTREILDSLHARNQWVQIDGSDFRKLFTMSRKRLILWVTLSITATPFHLL